MPTFNAKIKIPARLLSKAALRDLLSDARYSHAEVNYDDFMAKMPEIVLPFIANDFYRVLPDFSRESITAVFEIYYEVEHEAVSGDDDIQIVEAVPIGSIYEKNDIGWTGVELENYPDLHEQILRACLRDHWSQTGLAGCQIRQLRMEREEAAFFRAESVF